MRVHYDAFISYRHTPLDSKIAGLIQKKLERARIPKAIRQQTGKTGFLRVFRDKEDGTFAREIRVDMGLFSIDGTEICMLNDGQATFYPVYSVEALTAKAWALVDGHPLSEADRIKYFIAG